MTTSGSLKTGIPCVKRRLELRTFVVEPQGLRLRL